MAIDLRVTRNDDATSFGSESILYIAECKIEGTADIIIPSGEETWMEFPCAIEETLSMEPKTGEILDDRGRVVYSYSIPSKVKYAFSIFQRNEEVFNFLRNCSDMTYVLWVVVGQVGTKRQEILMYGKIGANYSESMSSDPKIPIEFSCEVNSVDIEASKPDTDCWANKIELPANEMIVKKDSPKT